MKSSYRRLLTAFTLLSLVLSNAASVATPSVAAQQDATGTLEIWLSDGVNPIAGACYTVTDATQTSRQVCDDDLDGRARIEGVAVGLATAVQTSMPDGYDGGASGDIEI